MVFTVHKDGGASCLCPPAFPSFQGWQCAAHFHLVERGFHESGQWEAGGPLPHLDGVFSPSLQLRRLTLRGPALLSPEAVCMGPSRSWASVRRGCVLLSEAGVIQGQTRQHRVVLKWECSCVDGPRPCWTGTHLQQRAPFWAHHCFPHRPCWDYKKPKSGSGFSLRTSPTDKNTILLSYNSLSPTKQGLLSELSQPRPEPRGDHVSSGLGRHPGQPALTGRDLRPERGQHGQPVIGPCPLSLQDQGNLVSLAWASSGTQGACLRVASSSAALATEAPSSGLFRRVLL